MSAKKRLDSILQELYPEYSRSQIQDFIKQGKVNVNNCVEVRPGAQYQRSVHLDVDFQKPKFVSRAGFKLEKALDFWNISVVGLTILDAGISTGGFTDCLLQRGAKKIYGVDVGHSQLDKSIASDARLVLMENTNLKELETVGELVNMVTLDLSFISVLKVIPAVLKLLESDGLLIVLIKPQFETSKDKIGRGGIVHDYFHADIVCHVVRGIEFFGFKNHGVIESPIKGASGNKEFLAYFVRISSVV